MIRRASVHGSCLLAVLALVASACGGEGGSGSGTGGAAAQPALEAPDAATRQALWSTLLDRVWIEAEAERAEAEGRAWSPETFLVLDGTGSTALFLLEPFRRDVGPELQDMMKDALLTTFPEADPDLIRAYAAFDHETPRPVPALDTVRAVGLLSGEDWADRLADPALYADLHEVHPEVRQVVELAIPLVSETGDEAIACAAEIHPNTFAGWCARLLPGAGGWSVDGEPVELWRVWVD